MIDPDRVLANPFYAINIDPILTAEHELFVSEDEWIAANAKVIEEMGAEAFLRQLLDVLKYPE